MSTIKSSTTTTTAYQVVADTTGALVIQTGATPTTALTISSAQVVTLAQVLPEASGGTGTTTGYNGFKNRIINGAMVIDQRNAGASVTLTASAYTLDRWRFGVSVTSKLSAQQNANSVTPPSGFTNYLGATSLSAYTVGAAEQFQVGQRIEGFNASDLGWGTADAKSVTLSFWVRSSLTGTFGGVLTNSAGNRSYPFTYTINSANTWEYETITIAGDTTGTWLTTNGLGIALIFGLGVGSTISGTAGAWAGAGYSSATGAVSLVGTNGATWYVTGVQLEKGSTATSFDYRPYGTELQLCQRYYETKDYSGSTARIAVVWAASTNPVNYQEFAVTKRATPTSITWALNGSGRYVSTVGIGSSQTLSSSIATVSGCTVGASSTFAVSVGWIDNVGTMQINAEL